MLDGCDVTMQRNVSARVAENFESVLKNLRRRGWQPAAGQGWGLVMGERGRSESMLANKRDIFTR